jgi:hypothetical protein
MHIYNIFIYVKYEPGISDVAISPADAYLAGVPDTECPPYMINDDDDVYLIQHVCKLRKFGKKNIRWQWVEKLIYIRNQSIIYVERNYNVKVTKEIQNYEC